MEEKKIGCVLMAAGNAKRFGENKLARQLQGKPLVQWALEAIDTGDFYKTVVVTQYKEVSALAAARGFTVVQNHRPEDGISHTIELGLAHLQESDGILFSVADQPCLTADTVHRVAEAWKNTPAKIIAAAHEGKRGNPCLFPREFFPELAALQGDHGGSSVIRRHEERLQTVEAEERELTDCDTPKALEDLKETLGDI